MVRVQIPAASFAIGLAAPPNVSLTLFALGALTRKVIVRSGWTSGETMRGTAADPRFGGRYVFRRGAGWSCASAMAAATANAVTAVVFMGSTPAARQLTRSPRRESYDNGWRPCVRH